MRSSNERDASASARASAGGVVFAVISRAAWFLGLWLVLAGADPADLPAAALAVAAATWTSLRLLPPGGSRRSPIAVAPLAVRFLYQSVVAGLDVGRRALSLRSRCSSSYSSWSKAFPR